MKQITQTRLVPVAVIDNPDAAAPLAEVLRESGVNIIEVTLRTPTAIESIREIVKAFPDMLVGAGTVLDIHQMEEARAAGAKFGVSPGLNETVVSAAFEREFPFVPGVMTPSEVERALALGCQMLKFFPAETAGGIRMLKALAGPYSHTGVRFIPLGGINLENAGAYLREPLVAAVGGSWFVDRKLIQAKDWKTIRQLTTEAVKLAAASAE